MTCEPAPYRLPDEAGRQAWQRLLHDYLVIEPLEAGFARRFVAHEIHSFVELGAAIGPISRLLEPRGIACTTLDLNPPPSAFRPLVRGDIRELPFPDDTFQGVSEVNCLYFVGEPVAAIEEARRVLEPGGLFLASTPSRHHDPELAHVVPWAGTKGTFDAEEAAELVSSVFDDVEAEWWEVRAYFLPDRQAVVDYLTAFGVPDVEIAADRVSAPLWVTKSGVNVWARA